MKKVIKASPKMKSMTLKSKAKAKAKPAKRISKRKEKLPMPGMM